jgi:hypothetical protein
MRVGASTTIVFMHTSTELRELRPESRLPILRLPRSDPLKYFSKDSPGWRLSALIVCKLPMTLFFLWLLVRELHALLS